METLRLEIAAAGEVTLQEGKLGWVSFPFPFKKEGWIVDVVVGLGSIYLFRCWKVLLLVISFEGGLNI